MTDKERIRKEVERLQNELIQEREKGYGSDADDACILELQNVLTYIDSLQEESVSEELEEVANKYGKETFVNECMENGVCDKYDLADAFKAGAKWQKQQMMAKAIDVEVKIDAGGYPYIPAVELYDYDNDVPLAKERDKYKVILIKED